MVSIIPKNIIAVENNWQKEIASAFSDPEELLDFLAIDKKLFTEHIEARRLFPMRVPRAFVEKMTKSNIQDPLFKQVFPLSDEFKSPMGYTTDPLGEQQNDTPGILHKYQSRVLLIVRGGCAVNCRYCFRRHFPYADNAVNKAGWQKSLQHIRQDSRINEVILSGGDPLMANDEFLAWLSNEISLIPHITRLRIHTRLPVVIPNRLTQEFEKWFTQSRLSPVLVLHINHAQEIDNKLSKKLARLKALGVTLLNQSVLLKGINDDAEVLSDLSEALFKAGILPYYLHVLDKVQGASHFDVETQQAKSIMTGLIKRLPGYLVPKLVREIADQPGKTPIDLNLHP